MRIEITWESISRIPDAEENTNAFLQVVGKFGEKSQRWNFRDALAELATVRYHRKDDEMDLVY